MTPELLGLCPCAVPDLSASCNEVLLAHIEKDGIEDVFGRSV
jgi:hypothetical protein